jgi:hypothetical protein
MAGDAMTARFATVCGFLLATVLAGPSIAQPDDRVLLEAGGATFRVPVRYLVADYRDGGVVEPIWVRYFGFSFWLSDRKPAEAKEPGRPSKGPQDIVITVTGAEVRLADPDDKRLMPHHRARIVVSHPLLHDYTKREEFGLEKHEYCGLDARDVECPTTYMSKPGASPQVFTRSHQERSPAPDPPWEVQVFYPEDRLYFWFWIPESALSRWKEAADAAATLMRSWRVP